MSFCVVHFLKSNEVDFVPKLWINESETKCRFPKTKLSDFENLKRDAECQPQNSWAKYKIRIIKTYGTALEAERGVSKYLESSDIESSEAEGHRSSIPLPCLVAVSSQLNSVPEAVPTSSVNILNHANQSSVADIGHSTSNLAETFQVVSTDTSGQIIVEPSYAFIPHPASHQQGNPPEDQRPASNSNELLLQILENQKILEQQINDIKKLLLPVLSRNSNNGTSDQFTPVSFIPISSAADLDSVEEWLKVPDNFKKLVTALSKIGGHEVSLTTYAALNYLFLHQFALQIRLTPKSGKIGIASTRVLEVVREAVRNSFPQATDKVINIYVGSWFRTSGDRKGGRKRRINGDPTKNIKAPRLAGSGESSGNLETTENDNAGGDE